MRSLFPGCILEHGALSGWTEVEPRNTRNIRKSDGEAETGWNGGLSRDTSVLLTPSSRRRETSLWIFYPGKRRASLRIPGLSDAT
ncbi:MAG: hypothetical protein JWO95_3174, partial [Verrucomicrobiales bacterium]|nr:hypothetical protein [Verrucomicrobiales bacterium]